MSYSIIGSGNIGSALARQFARKGISVAIANQRGPDSLQLLKKELGEDIVPQTIEAALTVNTVILAVPHTAVSAIARRSRDWKGKIVVDATNAIDFPSYASTDLGGRLSSELVTDQLRGARVVKAFNTIGAVLFGDSDFDMFYCGDDEEAKYAVRGLIGDTTMSPVDAGPLKNARYLEQIAGLWVDLAVKGRIPGSFGFKLMRK